MRFFDNLVLRLTGKDLAEERRQTDLARALDQAQTEIASGVKQMLAYPLKDYTHQGSYPGWGWMRLWMSVYLIDNPRSQPPIDQSVTEFDGQEVLSLLFRSSRAWAIEEEACSEFARHVKAIADGVHPWSSAYMNSREIPQADLRHFRDQKAIRMIKGNDNCMPLSEIIPRMKKHGIYKPSKS